MTRRLYTVTVEHEVVVLAASEEDAETLGESLVHSGDCDPTHVGADEIKTLKGIPPAWRDEVPWAEPDDDGPEHDWNRTCAEWLALFDEQDRATREEAEFAARQLPLPGTGAPETGAQAEAKDAEMAQWGEAASHIRQMTRRDGDQ